MTDRTARQALVDADKHCGICGATTEPLQPETGGLLGGFMECVDDAACLIRAFQADEPEAALAMTVDPEEE